MEVRAPLRVSMCSMMKGRTDTDSEDAVPSAGAAAREAALEEAALWLARLDSGAADPAAFARWRDADPTHAVAFARVAGAWRSLEAPAAPIAKAPAPRLSRRAAVLALAGLAAAGGSLGVSGRVLARERASTGVGERRAVRLAPGAFVEINTDSRLSWRARGGGVTLWLEKGEAAMMVGPGAEPVILNAARAVCRLAPGRYNVRLRDDRLELLTLDGLARSEGLRVVRAGRGERLVVRAGGSVSVGVAPPAALDTAAAWPRGEVVFDNVSLAQAAAEYNRYLDEKLIVADPEVGRQRIGGRFTSARPDDFLVALEAALPVRARRTTEGVRLEPAK